MIMNYLGRRLYLKHNIRVVSLRREPTAQKSLLGTLSHVHKDTEAATAAAHFQPPPVGEQIAAKLIGAVCFFWIFYQMRKEGAVYLVDDS